ncbi:hypothetical protein MANES_06G051701v8 [Manihot esculenta]|uniref:Uncharacterized protein n=1 Tax=Manihot esculenta TaxID=3983 RepID=A0ACB7HHT6_MANES|nr:hypothetical protein MANES_06G051701v8 [Manihot esculenta]
MIFFLSRQSSCPSETSLASLSFWVGKSPLVQLWVCPLTVEFVVSHLMAPQWSSSDKCVRGKGSYFLLVYMLRPMVLDEIAAPIRRMVSSFLSVGPPLLWS